MPELPEVETTLRGIAPHIEGKAVSGVEIRQPSLRWPIPDHLANTLAAQSLSHITRRGKYLLMHFETGTLLVHLGMSGSLRIAQAEEPPLYHDHVDIAFGNNMLRYCDPRRFGCMLWAEGDPHQHSLLRNLGPEPLSEAFSGEYLYAKSRKRSIAVKQFIMTNEVVVGVGNIYANESLFMAGIKPIKKASALTKAQCNKWVEDIRFVLQRSITQGGTTLKDFVGGDGKPGYFQQQLLVYGRAGKPCKQCQKPLKEVRMNGRSTVYCTACQR